MRLVKQMMKQQLWLFVEKQESYQRDVIISKFTIYTRIILINEIISL